VDEVFFGACWVGEDFHFKASSATRDLLPIDLSGRIFILNSFGNGIEVFTITSRAAVFNDDSESFRSSRRLHNEMSFVVLREVKFFGKKLKLINNFACKRAIYNKKTQA